MNKLKDYLDDQFNDCPEGRGIGCAFFVFIIICLGVLIWGIIELIKTEPII